MRILFLASRIPYPIAHGEDLRVYHLARHLAERHELHLMGYASPTSPEVLGHIFRDIEIIGDRPDHARPSGTMERLMRALFSDALFDVDPRVEAALRRRLQSIPYDLLWIPAWEMIPPGVRTARIPICLDVMDDGVLEHARDLRRIRSPLDSLVRLKRLLVNARFERRYFPLAARCVVVSDRDAAVLRMVVPTARVAVIHNGVDAEYFRPLETTGEPDSLVFEGSMGFPPSVDAIVHFHHAVFPMIRREIPDVRLSIVGRDPADAVRALAGPRVRVTGFVDDVRPFLASASVFVCPMRTGAGIKNKILQAWAMARPVVATTISCGGLRAEDGVNIVIRDSAQGMAKATCELLRDPARRQAIGQAARRTVLEHYAWDQKTRELESLFEEVLREPARAEGSACAI